MNDSTTNKGYQPMMNEYFPSAKKRSPAPIFIFLALAAAVLIGWLIVRNNQNATALQAIESELTQKQLVDEKQQSEKKRLAVEKAAADARIAKKNMNYRNNWDRFIKILPGKPNINYALGGISPFSIQLSNETDCMLEQADVLVKYIRKNGDVWQSRVVSFTNVEAYSNETKIAPSSVNGVEINVAVQKVISKKMNFCYPVGMGGSEDPYYCK